MSISILFKLFGGIFLGILATIFLFPLYPKEKVYQNNDLVIYSNFQGFMAACCKYEVVRKQHFIFEYCVGTIKVEGGIKFDSCEIQHINNKLEYKHKIEKSGTIINKDTIEYIKFE